MRTLTAILLGKAIFTASRIFKLGGGHAAPGLYALKINQNLVEDLINNQAKNIVITGTNGKTTTSKLISHFLNTTSEKVIRNSSGSNLERGIASYLINHARISGKLDYETGVWELDEFAFNSVAPKIKPNIVILLNAFRDQLDRYGEVDTVIKRWQDTLKKLSPETILIINGDDNNLLKTVKDFKGKVLKIGVLDSKIKGESQRETKAKLDYEAKIINSDLEKTEIKVKYNSSLMDFTVPLPGNFNVYNFLAALAVSHLLNLDISKIKDSLKDFTPSFGRNEKFKVDGKQGNIFLIKNPVGATQVLQTVLPNLNSKDSLLIALNDNFADGKDVSWIWDIEIEKFQIPDSKYQIFVSGSRAYDMALRLKYAGVDEKRLNIDQNLEVQFDKAIKQTQGKSFILPTYTALMELQKILVKKGVKQEYWKE